MLIEIVIGLIVIGLLLYLVQMLPIDPAIRQIIRAVVIIAVIIWLLRLVGVVKMV